MKINTSLALRQALVLEEDINLDNVDLNANVSLKGINSLRVKTITTLQGNLFKTELEVKANLGLECAYTLELFTQDLNFEDVLYFATKEDDEETEDVFIEKGPLIDLDPYIFGLILAHIPLRVVKPGAKLPSGGESFVVQTEDEYYKERSTTNNPFDNLNLEEFED